MDTDGEARAVLDRMSVDFSQMIKRPDVDAYVKGLDSENGNDRIAFFGNVAGYPPTGAQSPTSVVAYRINGDSSQQAFGKMERMGKGLAWNGVSTTAPSFVFGLNTIVANWPAATDSSTADSDYEVLGPEVFRFEYSYILSNGTIAIQPPPTGIPGIAAICVTIAVLDPKSRALLSNSQISTLIGALGDFDPARPNLAADWQSSLDGTSGIPKRALAAIKIYQRYFYLSQN